MPALYDSRPYGGALSGDGGWLVVQTKRHKERTVKVALGREGIRRICHSCGQWPRPAVGGDIGPMFPGYVFCQPDPVRLSAVASCRGASASSRSETRRLAWVAR